MRRRGADGNFTVLPAGAAYFRHHRSLWIPLIPRVIINRPKGGEYTARKSRNGIDYMPLAKMPQLTTATLRERTGGQWGDALVATDAEQEAEAIAAARAYILTLDTMLVDGKSYYILYRDSQVDHAFDEDLPILVSKQNTTFYSDNRPATTETVLERPLRGDPQIPELL